MERLTERNKHGVAVLRMDRITGTLQDNPVARLAAYEDSGIDPDMVAVIGWVGKPAWILCMRIPGGKLDVVEGKVTQVVFGGRITPKVEVMIGTAIYQDLEPENVFLTREDADVVLAEIAEREAGR